MRGLTRRQAEVLSAIKDMIAKKGYSPTTRELGERIGVPSTNGVHDHLKALKRKGYITWVKGLSRSINLVGEARPGAPQTSSPFSVLLDILQAWVFADWLYGHVFCEDEQIEVGLADWETEEERLQEQAS